MRYHESILIGGSFTDYQMLWVIYIIKGYAEINNINKFIFTDQYTNQTKVFISKVLGENTIITYKKPDSSNFISVLISFFKMPNSILFSLFLLNRKRLLKERTNWGKYQLAHSIWDLALAIGKDGELKPSFINKLKSVFLCHISYLEGINFSENISFVFLGHSVYRTRALIAGLRKNYPKKEIIVQACECLYKLPFYRDISAFKLPKKEWALLFHSQKFYEIDIFKKNRLKGISKNFDTLNASKTFQKFQDKIYSENQVFLHTFKDSPFNFIDSKRIFADYIDWAAYTIKTICRSKENWTIRIHPSSVFWGEDSYIFIVKILEKIKYTQLPRNIIIEKDSSNLEVLKNAKRIVTFSGTVALEACAYGIRPIVISETTPSSYKRNLVLKAKNKKEYKRLLLQNAKNKIFKLDDKDIKNAWKLLYACENQISLRDFVNSETIFRGDKKSKIDKNYLSIKNTLIKNTNKTDKLVNLGKQLANNDIILSANAFVKNIQN